MNRLIRMFLWNLPRIPGVLWQLCRYAQHPDRYPEIEKYRHIQSVMRLAVQAGRVDVQVYGQAHIPAENGFLIYANHQGLFDVVALAATCDRPLAAVFKKELAHIPFLRQVIACTGSLAMDREDVRQSLTVIQSVTEQVRSGRNYLIFPEGTRSRSGNTMRPFHGGSFRCAVKAKCPILPVAFIDSYQVLDQKGSQPVSMQIRYLPPIFPAEYASLKTSELAALVQSRIQQAITDATDAGSFCFVETY